MVSARWASVAGLMILVAAGCENAQPTEPALGAPSAAAPAANHGNNGNGSKFTPVTGATTLIVLDDDNGNSCEIGYSDQQGAKDRSDFFRDDPSGSQSIHTTDSDASLSIEFEGQHYEGVGHAVLVARTNADVTAYVKVNTNATGKVVGPDGQTYNAKCMGRVNDDGLSWTGTIDVH